MQLKKHGVLNLNLKQQRERDEEREDDDDIDITKQANFIMKNLKHWPVFLCIALCILIMLMAWEDTKMVDRYNEVVKEVNYWRENCVYMTFSPKEIMEYEKNNKKGNS